MKFADIDFPQQLLTALVEQELVVFAGAGVSMGKPACLPDFKGLKDKISRQVQLEQKESVNIDEYFGRLKKKGVDVHSLVRNVLNSKDPGPTELHKNIVRLFSDFNSVRIVTTNFDQLFEKSATQNFDTVPEVFRAPALPLGNNFHGIVDLHGNLSKWNQMILTDSDFGRAYLTEGFARRFLIDLFQKFTVLFVGYSHSDTIMNYLARALPVTDRKRYVLSCSDDADRWELLGIDLIRYSKSNNGNHEKLYTGIEKLADFRKRGLFGWKRKIRERGSQPPGINSREQKDFMDLVMSDPVKTRFFTNVAAAVEWVDCINDMEYLNPLFGSEELKEQHRDLAEWMASKFACSSPYKLFGLIIEHGRLLNLQFWGILVNAVAGHSWNTDDKKELSQWIWMLLDSVPSDLNQRNYRTIDQTQLLKLSELCFDNNFNREILQCLDLATKSEISLRSRNRSFKNDPTKYAVEFHESGYYIAVNRLWKDYVKPKLDDLVEPLLNIAVRRLENLHETLVVWEYGNRETDGASVRRKAIEPNDQNIIHRVYDIWVDAARDSLEWLAQHNPEIAEHWRNKLIVSDAPLLRRLAVHVLSCDDQLSVDKKVDWIVERVDIHERAIRHEISRVLKNFYPASNQTYRKKLIKLVRYNQTSISATSKQTTALAQQQYDWLQWFLDAAPGCSQASQALQSISSKYPNFQKNGLFNFLFHTSRVDLSDEQAPWTAEELVQKSAAERLPTLISYERDEIKNQSNFRIFNVVAEAAKKKFDWGLELGAALVCQKEWATSLWQALIGSWEIILLNKQQHRQILELLSSKRLFEFHSDRVANFLYALVKNGGVSHAFELLPKAKQIALDLWDQCERKDPAQKQCEDWLSWAINHPAGTLTLFWFNAYMIDQKHLESQRGGLDEKYAQVFINIIQDQTLAGRFGRSIIAGQFHLLLGIDEKWTRTNVLPLFKKTDNIAEFHSIWDGFLSWGRLEPNVAKLLAPAFLVALRNIDSRSMRAERFVSYYTEMADLFIDDPLAEWIPKLIASDNADFKHQVAKQNNIEFHLLVWGEFRHQFAIEINTRLRHMDKEERRVLWERWLKKYWDNRLQRIPRCLDATEIRRMMDWLPKLSVVFTESVELALRIQPTKINDFQLFHELKTGDFPEKFPNETSKLLIHLGNFKLPDSMWDTDGKELINRVLECSQLESNLYEHKLRELKLQFDLD